MTSKFNVTGLGDDETSLLNALYDQFERVSAVNAERDLYVDHHRLVRGLGLDRRADAAAVAMTLGWCYKAVDSLASLVINDGPVIPGSDLSKFDIDRYWRENNLAVESSQVEFSSYVHSVAFLITTRGDVDAGEPEVLITPKDANSGTGFYNTRRRGLDSFLSITEVDEKSKPREMALYLPGQVVVVATDAPGSNAWEVVDEIETGLPYVPVEAMPFSARTGRPFGSSRVTHSMMGLQDAALRTLVRTDIAAEDYISPVRLLLNADMDRFKNPDGTPNAAWYALSKSKMVGLPVNLVDHPDFEEPKAVEPKFEQIPGADMTPFSDLLEMLAAQFSAESSIPQSELGVRGSSIPVSAESINAHKDTLIRKAEAAGAALNAPYVRSLQTAYRLGHDTLDLPPEVEGLAMAFRDPSTPSRGAMADAVYKEITSGILPATSDVAMERLGYSATDIARVKADRVRTTALSALDALTGKAADANG